MILHRQVFLLHIFFVHVAIFVERILDHSLLFFIQKPKGITLSQSIVLQLKGFVFGNFRHQLADRGACQLSNLNSGWI